MLYLVFLLILVHSVLVANAAKQTWLGNFANPKALNRSAGSFTTKYITFMKDPIGGVDTVLRVAFPNGSYPKAEEKGGAFFKMKPFGEVEKATLEYSVLFPESFDFVKGGKLPGLFGGNSSAGFSSCSGHDPALNCFSTRYMWGSNATGYPYLYLPRTAPHTPEFMSLLQAKNNKATYTGGYSGKEIKYFTPGKWNKLKQTIQLNTVGKANGRITIWVDGVQKFFSDQVIYRINGDVKIAGIFFSTFFGGDTIDWAASKDEVAYFKNFKYDIY